MNCTVFLLALWQVCNSNGRFKVEDVNHGTDPNFCLQRSLTSQKVVCPFADYMLQCRNNRLRENVSILLANTVQKANHDFSSDFGFLDAFVYNIAQSIKTISATGFSSELFTFQMSPHEKAKKLSVRTILLLCFLLQEMASKKKMGYKGRIAVVLLLLLTSVAALVAVAVIQDTWSAKEYSTEVNTHSACTCRNARGCTHEAVGILFGCSFQQSKCTFKEEYQHQLKLPHNVIPKTIQKS